MPCDIVNETLTSSNADISMMRGIIFNKVYRGKGEYGNDIIVFENDKLKKYERKQIVTLLSEHGCRS